MIALRPDHIALTVGHARKGTAAAAHIDGKPRRFNAFGETGQLHPQQSCHVLRVGGDFSFAVHRNVLEGIQLPPVLSGYGKGVIRPVGRETQHTAGKILNRAGDGIPVAVALESHVDLLGKVGQFFVVCVGEGQGHGIPAGNGRFQQFPAVGRVRRACLVAFERELLHRDKFVGQTDAAAERASLAGDKTRGAHAGGAVDQREFHSRLDQLDICRRLRVEGQHIADDIPRFALGIGKRGGGNAAHIRHGHGNRFGFRRTVARAVHRGDRVDTGCTRQMSRMGEAAVIGASNLLTIAGNDIIGHSHVIGGTRPAQYRFRTEELHLQIRRYGGRGGIGRRRRTGTRHHALTGNAVAVHGIEGIGIIAVGGNAFVGVGGLIAAHFRKGFSVAVNDILSHFVRRRVPVQRNRADTLRRSGEVDRRFHHLIRLGRHIAAHGKGQCLPRRRHFAGLHNGNGGINAVRQPRQRHAVVIDV